jgi:hypothetical protein
MSSRVDPAGDYCRLSIRVKCCSKIGQFVGVQGFGLAKDENDYIKLVTTPEAYPVWFTSVPIVIPRGELVNYKYCVLEDGAVTFIEQVSNPRLLIPEGEDTVVEDEFDLSLTEEVDSRKYSNFDIEDFISEHASQSGRLTGGVGSLDETEQRKSDWKRFGIGNSKLFLVCYHLPVIIKRTNRSNEPFEAIWAESLIAKSGGSISVDLKTIWVGTISISDLTPSEKSFVIILLGTMDCIPVFLDDQLAKDAYQGFCKMIMWPVFHNVDQLDQIHAAWNLPSSMITAHNNEAPSLANSVAPSASNSPHPPFSQHGTGGGGHSLLMLGDSPSLRSGINSRKARSASSLEAESKVLEWNKREEEFYDAYKKVNEIFANCLVDLVHDNDVVWVHDYHLMLVPGLLRPIVSGPDSILKGLKIIFFLHIPFPTSQIFRTLPESTDLLQSMVCSDLVGFHAFDHARHFLNAVRRSLGYRTQQRQGGMLTLAVKDREVIVTMSHVSIETETLDTKLADPETQRIMESYQAKYPNRHIILGRVAVLVSFLSFYSLSFFLSLLR